MRVNHQATEKKKDRAQIKADNLLNNLKTKTPEEVAQWIDNNVTDLASAKQVLRSFAKVLVLISKELGE